MRIHSNIMDRAVGVTPETTAEENLKTVEAFFHSKHPEYEAKEDSVRRTSAALDDRFHAHGLETGLLNNGCTLFGR